MSMDGIGWMDEWMEGWMNFVFEWMINSGIHDGWIAKLHRQGKVKKRIKAKKKMKGWVK